MQMTIFGKGKSKKRRTLKEAIRNLEDQLSDSTLKGEDRKAVIDELKQLSQIVDSRKTAASNVAKVVGTVAILGFAAVAGYKMDLSDQIVRNKTSFSLFGKLAKL